MARFVRSLAPLAHRTLLAVSGFGTLCALLIYAPVIASAQSGPFKRAARDPQAVYAIHATRSSTEQGKWNMRETIKLCPLATPMSDERGTAIRFIAVSPSNPCPEALRAENA